jgi:hypothetical protein
METVRVGRNGLCPCGSGRKSKRCCQNQLAAGGAGRITAFEKARPVFGDGAETRHNSPQPALRRGERDGQPIERIPIHYTYAEPFGQAECVYCFPVDQQIILDNGSVIPARWLQAGMLFRMEDGTLGTVTAVEPTKVWGPPSPTPDRHGNYARRVLGTIKHKGFAVLDVTFGGQTVTTSPDHLFWSASREAWVAVGSMRPGELLRSVEGAVATVETISPPRYGFIELYNLEVEELHTFFVGASGPGSALVHNGKGNYIKKPLQADAQGNRIPHGFSNADEFQQFGSRLRGGLPEGTQPLFQGSSVTGRSYKTGKAFDAGRQSDFDIALAGPDLFGKAKDLNLKAKDGTRIGPLSPKNLEDLGLSDLQRQLSELAGRPVKFMLFNSIEEALRRPSLWVL